MLITAVADIKAVANIIVNVIIINVIMLFLLRTDEIIIIGIITNNAYTKVLKNNNGVFRYVFN